MDALEITRLILLALHILGLAAIIGAFLVQLRKKSDYNLSPMLAGAITQLVTGVALVAVRESADLGVNSTKIAVKLIIAIVVLAAVIVAMVQQRRGKNASPWFHTAGGLAVVNVLVAVFWQ
jgi:high-affinity Fe2+/Pb2+ permease